MNHIITQNTFVMYRYKTIFIALFIIAVPLAAFGLWHFYEIRFLRLPVLGPAGKDAQGKSIAHEVTDFSFLDQDSSVFSYHDWQNKIKAVDFFYTRCISTCPKMTLQLKRVQQAFMHDQAVGIISLTVDPEADTPWRLKQYARQMGAGGERWQFLTGNKKAIYRLARQAFLLTVSDGDGGVADFIHSDEVVLVDKKNHIRGYYDGTRPQDIDLLINDIKKLEHEEH